MRPATDCDLAIVGASFAGLVAAATAAARGLRVVVLEGKANPGARVRTTGILVKEAAEELDFPTQLTRKIRGVRLYAPNLKHVDLVSPGYYFLATDTPAILEWLAQRAKNAGVELICGSRFAGVRVRDARVEIEPSGSTTRFVLGADGALSAVARTFGLGRNRNFLVGLEEEFPIGESTDEFFHCFLDSALAPGYLGWAVPGINSWQVGLAVRWGRKPDLKALIKKIATPLNFNFDRSMEQRSGLIPCGGTVWPIAHKYALLVGDAAGLVSPLTGGGIHCAIHYGRRAALAICDYLCDGGTHPGVAMAQVYPTFRAKRLLRVALNVEPPAGVYNLGLNSAAFLSFARWVYFRNRRTEPQLLETIERPQSRLVTL